MEMFRKLYVRAFVLLVFVVAPPLVALLRFADQKWGVTPVSTSSYLEDLKEVYVESYKVLKSGELP
jgi:hypothetical protein